MVHPSSVATAASSDWCLESVSSTDSLTRRGLESRRLCLLHCEVALNGGGQCGQVEWFFDVVVGTNLQRFTLVLPLIERRDHHDPHTPPERWVLLHDPADLPSVAAGHHDVE